MRVTVLMAASALAIAAFASDVDAGAIGFDGVKLTYVTELSLLT